MILLTRYQPVGLLMASILSWEVRTTRTFLGAIAYDVNWFSDEMVV